MKKRKNGQKEKNVVKCRKSEAESGRQLQMTRLAPKARTFRAIGASLSRFVFVYMVTGSYRNLLPFSAPDFVRAFSADRTLSGIPVLV